MNINQLLINTLSGHGPVAADVYEGKESKYLTFNYPDEVGALYGDNRPRRTIVYVQVHLYLDDTEPYQTEKLQICMQLREAGFSWPEVTVLHEPGTGKVGKRHIIFETKIKNFLGWEE